MFFDPFLIYVSVKDKVIICEGLPKLNRYYSNPVISGLILKEITRYSLRAQYQHQTDL